MKREDTTKTVKKMRQVEISEEVQESFFVADDGKAFAINTYYYPGQITINKQGYILADGKRVETIEEAEQACLLHDERYANALKAGLWLPGEQEPSLRRLASTLEFDPDEHIKGVYWVSPIALFLPKDIETIYAYLVARHHKPDYGFNFQISREKLSLIVLTEDNSGDYTHSRWKVYSIDEIRKFIDDSIERLEDVKQSLPD